MPVQARLTNTKGQIAYQLLVSGRQHPALLSVGRISISSKSSFARRYVEAQRDRILRGVCTEAQLTSNIRFLGTTFQSPQLVQLQFRVGNENVEPIFCFGRVINFMEKEEKESKTRRRIFQDIDLAEIVHRPPLVLFWV